jgi:tetratricopeptide (TPR) repeat protein
MPGWFDVYISYCAADSEWARQLADGLRDRGVEPYLREFAVPGTVLVHQIDQALSEATAAIVVVSQASTEGSGPPREYAALAELADLGQLVLIPVCRDGSHPPPMLDARVPVDFSQAQSAADHSACIDQLVAALRGKAVIRPRAHIDFDRVPEGPLQVTVKVDSTSVTLSPPAGDSVVAAHQGVSAMLRQLVDDHDRGRRSADRRTRAGRPGATRTAPSTLDVGQAIGRAYLAGPIGLALADLVALANQRNLALRLAMDFDDAPPELADLPWESTTVPGMVTPLALLPRVRMYRHAPLGPTAQPTIPGPLRILAVIASPDHGGGELLDYEHELSAILDQVEDARRGDAYVRILNWGSVDAIREALARERFHILHISGHAAPGLLVLEKPDGEPDYVDAATFVRELVIPERGVPLVVLAGCFTARTAAINRHTLPGFARTLLEGGVPSVLAMTSAVSDLYATDLLAATYGALARSPDAADPLAALSDARHRIESQRQLLPAADPRADVRDWAAPTLFTRVRRSNLFDPTAPPGEVSRPRRTRVAPDIVELDPGEFVGRRAELRRLIRAMKDRGHRGVVIHGIGGVGKSSLAVQLVRMLDGDRRTVVSLHGRPVVEGIFAAIARQLRAGPLRDEAATVSRALTEATETWEVRLDLLSSFADEQRWEVLLLLDDPLGDPLDELGSAGGLAEVEPEATIDPQLGAFLDLWLSIPQYASLVMTVRQPGSLSQSRLVFHHLGPLSWAEARKMIWRLPAVFALGSAEQVRAYENLGGHPRSLEYLDALLRGGQTGERPRDTGARDGSRPFTDITRRLELVLRARGIADPRRWIVDRKGDVASATAEAVAAASAEVLLERLFAWLTGTFPLAADLLVAASVSRQPTDQMGLNWVVADVRPIDQARAGRLRTVYDALRLLRRDRPGASLDDLPEQDRNQAALDLSGDDRPAERGGLAAARDRLLNLTLLTPLSDGQLFLVHRWTARSLAALADPEDIRQAHLKALAYRRWRARVYARDADHGSADLEEARYHCLAAGDDDQLIVVSADLCAALQRQGAFDRVRQICQETLLRLPENDPQSRLFAHTLAVAEMWRGEYYTAERFQRRCLTLATAAGDIIAEATSYQQLGVIAQLRGDLPAARAAYDQATERCWRPEVENRPAARLVVAACYQQLGAMALAHDDVDAWRWSDGALQSALEVGLEADLARGELELARLARSVGAAGLADEHEFRAHDAWTAGQNVPWLVAASTLQLGAVKLLQGAPVPALDHMNRAVAVARDLSDLPLFSKCLQLLGDVLFEVHDYGQAEAVYHEFTEVVENLDDRPGHVVALQQLGRVSIAQGDPVTARRRLDEAMSMAAELNHTGLIAATHLFQSDAACLNADQPVMDMSLREALRLAESTGDDAIWIAAATRLATMAAAARDLAEAASWCERALERAYRVNNSAAVVACQIALGLLAREEGRDAAAVLWLADAEAVAKSAGSHQAIVNCRLHLGRIALDHHEHGDAERRFRSCLDLLDQGTAPDLVADVWRELGRSLADRKELGEAADALNRALSGYLAADAVDRALWCLLHLCWIYRQTGDDEAAAKVMRAGGQLATRLPPSPLRVVGLLAQGDEALDRDDFVSATDAFSQALASARDCGVPSAELVAECRRQLGDAAHRGGRTNEAADHYQHAASIADSQGDRIGRMHDLRQLGRVMRDARDEVLARQAYEDSLALAETLNDRYAAGLGSLLLAELADVPGHLSKAESRRRAERLLLDTTMRVRGGRVEGERLFVKVTGDWTDVCWIRRLTHIDGELPFVDSMVTYLGPSVEEVLRQMVSRRSVISGIPAVVWPHHPIRRPS